METDAYRSDFLHQVQKGVQDLNAAEVQMINLFLGNGGEKEYHEACEIRAEVLRRVLLLYMENNGAEKMIVPDGISICGKDGNTVRITGNLDLRCFDIPFPVIFHHCEFADVILSNASAKFIDFNNCAFHSFYALNSRVDGGLLFTKSTFTGMANLRGIKVCGDLRLTGANFPSYEQGTARLILDRADIGGTLYLNAEPESGRFSCFGEVNLKGISIRGNLNCEGGYFENPTPYIKGEFKKIDEKISEDMKPHTIVVNQAVIRGNVYLRKDRLLQHPFESHGQILMIESEIFGKLDCGGAVLRGSRGNDDVLATDRTRIRGSAYLWYCDSYGQIHFRGTRIDGDLHLTSGEFYISAGDYHAPLDLQRLKVEGSLFLDGIETRQVYLAGARIGADLDCTGAKFMASGPEAPPSGTHAPAGAVGILGIDAYGAVIGGELRLDGISFVSAESNDSDGSENVGEDVARIVDLGGACATRLSLPWADRCTTRPEIEHGTPIQLKRPDWEADPARFVLYYLSRFKRSFEAKDDEDTQQDPPPKSAKAGRRSALDVLLHYLTKWQERIMASRFLERVELRANQKRALLRQYERSTAWIRQKWTVRLKGFSFSYVNGCDTKELAYRWLDRIEFDTQPYDQLAAVLAGKGREGMARSVLVRKEHLRRMQHPWWYRFDKYLFGGLYRATVGYGYRPERALAWAAIIIMLGCVFFAHGYNKKWFAPNEIEAYTMLHESGEKKISPPTYVAFNPFLYTLDVFVPTLDLGQKKNWHPVEPRSEVNSPRDESKQDRFFNWVVFYYYPAAVVLGWILIVIAILGPIGVIKKSIPKP
jgi:hypothetical protein